MKHIISPKTKRLIQVDGLAYKNLIIEGWISDRRQIVLPNDIIGHIYSYIPISKIKIINQYTNELLSTKMFWKYKNNDLEVFKNYKPKYFSLKECVEDYYNQYHIDLIKNIRTNANFFIHKNVTEEDYDFLFQLSNKTVPNDFKLNYNMISIWIVNEKVMINIADYNNYDTTISINYISIIDVNELVVYVLNHYRDFNVRLQNNSYFTLT